METLSPSLLLDLRYSINRQLLSRIPQSYGFDITSLGGSKNVASAMWANVFLVINVSDYQCLGCSSNGDYLRRGDLTHAVQGSITKIAGAHTFVGGDFRMFRCNDIQASDINLTFSFTRGWTQQDPFVANSLAGWGLASLLLGTPASGLTTLPASTSRQFHYGSGYVQDDWRVNSRLTLILGFRYDIETPYAESSPCRTRRRRI